MSSFLTQSGIAHQQHRTPALYQSDRMSRYDALPGDASNRGSCKSSKMIAVSAALLSATASVGAQSWPT